jgi:hypothetical protein
MTLSGGVSGIGLGRLSGFRVPPSHSFMPMPVGVLISPGGRGFGAIYFNAVVYAAPTIADVPAA